MAIPTIPMRSSGTQLTRRVPLPWPKDRPFRILSIDGGGIRGILPAAFLAGLERKYLGGHSVADYFDLIAGTSTGGIIALGLGKGLPASAVLDLYVHRGGEVFPDHGWLTRTALSVWHWVGRRCDTDALRALLAEAFGETCLWESKKRLCIPAVDGRHGEVFIYKTPHHDAYRLDWSSRMVDVALATSAAPTFFRHQPNGGYLLVDGGLWANNPVMVALVDALACFDVPRENIRILSLGCVGGRYPLTWGQRVLGGLIPWRSAMLGVMALQSQNVIGQAGLLVGRQNLLRIDTEAVAQRLELHDWAASVRILPDQANALLTEHGSSVAATFLSEVADGYSPIYTPSMPPPQTGR